MGDSENDKNYIVPGRISVEHLHQEQKELMEAKKAMEGKPKSPTLLNAMGMFNIAIDFALSLAVPLIAAIYLGKWLDEKYQSKAYTLACVLAALVISGISIYKQIQKLSKFVKK